MTSISFTGNRMSLFSNLIVPCRTISYIWILSPLFLVPATQADELYVANWNVENLFDVDDDPQVELDEEYTPTGPRQWTAERLEKKLDNLSAVISKLNDGRGPDVLGLCEVENRKIVERLLAKLAPLGRRYEIVHQDSPSDRGIDCALVYDSGVFELAETKFHFVDADKSRDIVEARLRRNDADLYMFVNHWPSRRNEEWQRIAAATVLRKRVDEILAADPQADIVMMGDFNDEPENVSVKEHLHAAAMKGELPPGALFNTTAAIREANLGSYVWDDQWQLIDQILVSPGLLDSAGYQWKADSSKRIDFPEVLEQSTAGGGIARPAASYTREGYSAKGCSDHLPMTCILVQ